MQMRNVYGQQQQVTQNPQNAQYAQQFMKPGPPPGQTVPPQMQQMQVQQQQMQQGMPPQQQLMPQARQQFPNQQAQFAQQQQMAQLRMMQQQAGARQAYPQSHPGHQMQFYNPAMAQRQQSFSAQQPLTMPVACGVPPPGVLGVPPRQPQRRNPQQAGDDQSDPLFMLNDM